MSLQEKDSITAVKGVGPKKAEALRNLNIETVGDMLWYMPRTYEDRRNVTAAADMEDGGTYLVNARVTGIRLFRRGRNKSFCTITCEDRSGTFDAVFFNTPYIATGIKRGMIYSIYGRATVANGKRSMYHPQMTPIENEIRGIIPVYPLTKGIRNGELIKIQQYILNNIEEIEDPLDEEIRQRNNICDISYAFSNVHFPEDPRKINVGRYRLVFDEFLVMQLGVGMMRSMYGTESGGIRFSGSVDEGEYIDSLGFELTGAQKRAVREITDDMESPGIMNRLLQGDVGSGKTVVAEIALFKAVRSGYQGVLMAPTEVLAKQHFADLKKHFEPFGIKVEFLGGALTRTARKEVLQGLADKTIDILVGTHAIIQPDVVFKDLGLVITDEQHRFGVNQRSLLTSKGTRPDRLVMTATPIPRTLTIIAFGDMDTSRIDELPKGRIPIITKKFDDRTRSEAYDILKDELQKGRQGYVVTPLIEETDMIEARSVNEVYDEVKKMLKGYRVEMLHGDMRSAEKERIMEEYAKGDIDVLVSTVVIEVGINVPNSTVMIIENTERFGLAQLHQLRGRIGRGNEQSYCLLVTGRETETSAERVNIMCETNDGFLIAEKDLELRGPGEVFGVRQHGDMDLRVADMFRHYKVLEKAQEEAKRILPADPSLDGHPMLKRRVKALFGEDITLDL